MAAAMKPSSRSMKPPWPGMRRLESLTLKRRLIQDSKQVADLRHGAGGEAEQEHRQKRRMDVGPEMRRDRAEDRAADDARRRKPDQVFPGEMRGAKLRAADQPAAEIGADIGAPDHGEQPADGAGAEKRRAGAERDGRQQQPAGVDHAEAAPRRKPRPAAQALKAAASVSTSSANSCCREALQRPARAPGAKPPAMRAAPRQRAADQAVPFPMRRRARPTSQNRPKTAPPHQQRGDRRRDQHQGRGGAQPQVAGEAAIRPGLARDGEWARAASGHDAVISFGRKASPEPSSTPPNRRSRALNVSMRRLRTPAGRNPARRSAGTPVRCRPTATSGNWTGAFRPRCG